MFPYFYLPEDAQTGKIKLYKNEEEVWDTLKNINESGTGIPTDILWAFQGIVNKILSNRRKKGYHPLDFPIVRYFLHPYWVESNLPFVQHPDFIKDTRRLFGDKKTQQFFQEIHAELPDNFYIRIYSLRAVWECAKFLEKQSTKITQFHSQVNSQQGSDISFEWKNVIWDVEVKNLSHIDINSFCITHTLAGMMYLENEGENLRSFNSIMIDGDQVNDTLREKVVSFIHQGFNRIFDDLKNATGYIPKVEGTSNELDIEAIQVNVDKVRVRIKSNIPDKELGKIELILNKRPKPKESIRNYYIIGPTQAYWWPQPFTPEFYNKLDQKIIKIGKQKEKVPGNYFGFLYLDLHEQNIDQRKRAIRKQEWEQIIEQHLNQVTFPLVLVTDSTRLQKSFYIMNRAAVNAGFKGSHQNK